MQNSKKKHSKKFPVFPSFRSQKSDEGTKREKSSSKRAHHSSKSSSGGTSTDYENSNIIPSRSSNSPPKHSTLTYNLKNKPLPSIPAEPEYETLPVDQFAKMPMDMTVSELQENLHYCGLGSLAEICQKNSLDGRFLFSLSDKQLGHKPYKQDQIQITKIRRMEQGWLPKK